MAFEVVEPHSHLSAKFALVQVPLSPECFALYHTVVILSSVGLLCWLVPPTGMRSGLSDAALSCGGLRVL